MAVKFTTALIVVLAVSSLVICAAVLFLIVRCYRRPKPAPLPPIRSLAHHREKDSTYFPHPHALRNSLGPQQLGGYESDMSLMRPSDKPSFHTDGSDATPSSSHYSFSSSPQTTPTPQPNPQPADEEQPSTTQTQDYLTATRRPRPGSQGQRRPRSRVISVASTNTTYSQLSPRPTSIIRGPPHSSLSSVQIVLPAPLAPQLQNHMVPSTSRRLNSEDFGASSHRRPTSTNFGHQYYRSPSTTDQWRRSGTELQLRGRTVSDPSVPSKLLGDADMPPPIPSKSAQTRPLNVTSQGPRNEQGDFTDRSLN